MTIHNLVNQLFDLSVAGHFNGERFTRAQLESHIRNAFRCEDSLKIPHKYVMEIALCDGRWLFTINHYNDAADGFDYTIPDNRDQEQVLRDLLTA